MKLDKNDKLVMIGDSITDCNRKQPIGEGREDALGQGYVSLVDALLGTVYAERSIRVVNMGISGNTVRDLKARWQSDVLDLKPDWLSIMIGINDVWRQFDEPLMTEKHIYLDEYESTLSELVRETSPLLKGLVLMSPFFIEANQSDAMRALMDEYGRTVERIAQRHDAIFVDTQAAFEPILAHRHPASLAWDRVHPNRTGHMVLAKAFLNAIEFSWN